MFAYIRKNHLTINEEKEIFEIVDDDGRVIFFDSGEGVTGVLGSDTWKCGDDVLVHKDGTLSLVE